MNFFSSTKSTMYNKCMPVDKGNLFVLFQKTRLDVLTIIYVAVSNKLLYRRAVHNDKLQMWLLFLCCLGRKFGLLIMIKNAAPMMTSYVTPLIEVLVPPTDPNYSTNGKLSAMKYVCVFKYILGLYEML